MTVKLSSLSKEIKSILYGCAWLAYIILAPLLFPILSITTLLISIALCMFGAWLFGFPGSIITTALTIPFHFILLHIYSDNAEIQKEAFNLFGISTQLCVSGSIALHRNNKLKMQRLNEKLESMGTGKKKRAYTNPELYHLHPGIPPATALPYAP